MKNLFLCICALLAAACASTPSVPSAPQAAETATDAAAFAAPESGALSIDRAIADMAGRVEARLKAGTRLAVVNVSSESANFSDYVIEELLAALDSGGALDIADRNALNMALRNREIDLQYSGEVSDETQESIGRMIGAQSLLSASFTDLGDAWRFRVAVFAVETMRREFTAGLDVAKDSRLNFLLTTASPLTRANNDNPQSPFEFRRRGSEYLNDQGDYDRAIADFTSAIRLKPQDADAYYLRGCAYYYKKDIDKALADFNEVVRLNPRYGAVYNDRGLMYVEKGDYTRAMDDLTQALTIDPANDAAYNNRAIIYLYRRDYQAALNDLNKSIGLNARDPAAYENRANAYVHLGQKQKAIQDLETAFTLDPNDEYVRMRLESLRDYGVWRE